MKQTMKRFLTGVLSLAAVFTTLPASQVQAAEKQYWTDAQEKAGYVEKVMNDGSIGSTFHEGIMQVEGETAYCIDINTAFESGYKTRSDASTRMSADQIADVALSLEYVKQYAASHKELNYKQVYLLEQCVVWQRLGVHLGWQCDNVRAAYDEISKAVQNEVYAGAKAFVKENKGRYECGGYIYTGNGQDLGQFWAKLAVGNATLQKSSANTGLTEGSTIYSVTGATYGVFADKGCTDMVDYDFAHLLFSDGTVEQSISLDRQLNVIQVADLVLPDRDTKFEEYTTMELLSVAMLIVISTFALDFIHSDRSIFKMVDLDEAWTFLQVAQGKALSNKLIRAGRSMNAAVYFVTQNSGDVDDEKMKNNIGLKFAFRSTDISEIKNTLEFFGVDKEDENNQKRLRDLENGQCLFQDLYGRVGVIQIHPVFADLFAAFDTRPPKHSEETR